MSPQLQLKKLATYDVNYGELIVMELSEQQSQLVEQIMRQAGYSSAWLLADDPTLTGFLVPEAELDWVKPYESAHMRATIDKLIAALPLVDAFIAAYRPGTGAIRVY